MSEDAPPVIPYEDDATTEHADSIDLSREWAWLAEQGREANQLFAGETPRGAAVLARAYVEAMIVDFLRLLAQREPDLGRKIKGILLSGLEKKIAALESYSEVSPRAVAHMRALMIIGNRFAHRPRTKTFNTPGVIELLRELERSTQEVDDASEEMPLPRTPEQEEPEAIAHRGQVVLAFALHLCIAAMSPLLVGDDPATENA